MPGGLATIRTRGQRFEKDGIAVEKVSASQDKALPPTPPHPRFLPNFLPRYLARLISPPLPGGLNIIRTRGQRFEKDGTAVEKSFGGKRGVLESSDWQLIVMLKGLLSEK